MPQKQLLIDSLLEIRFKNMVKKSILLLFFIMLLFNVYAEIGEQSTKKTDKILELDAKIPDKFKQVLSGEYTLVQINLQFFEVFKLKDVYIVYTVKSLKGDIVTIISETFAAQTRVSSVKDIFINPAVKAGNYLIDVKVVYGGVEANASDYFEVVEKHSEQPMPTFKTLLILGVILLIILVFSFVIYKEIKKTGERLFQKPKV